MFLFFFFLQVAQLYMYVVKTGWQQNCVLPCESGIFVMTVFLDIHLFLFQALNADVEMCSAVFIDILINMTAVLTTRQMAGPRFQRIIQ